MGWERSNESGDPGATGTGTGTEAQGDPRSAVHDHEVLFHRDPAEVLPDLVDFVVQSLDGDGRCMVIAAAPQLRELMRSIPADVLRRLPPDGRLVLLDSDVTLKRCLLAGSVDHESFDEVVGDLARSLAGDGGGVSAYSDMAGPLWRSGNLLGALDLEQMWERLQRELGHRMLCAYPLSGPSVETDEALSEVCQLHSRVQLGHAHAEAAGSLGSDVGEVVLECTRRLLRTSSPEAAVGELMAVVGLLGGTTVSVFSAPPTALPIDLSLGVADPVLPDAPLGSTAREDIARLLPRLVEDARFVADRAERLGYLSEQVDTDPLTGLGNRRGLLRVRSLSEIDTVAMVDLDFFKRVNDTHGHEGGDRVLVGFSRPFRRHLRAEDQAFRLGGEEFLLILAGTTPEGALVALDNLREQWVKERPLEVTFSGGVAAVTGGDLEAAVQAADRALYIAKESGRDRFEIAETEPRAAHG